MSRRDPVIPETAAPIAVDRSKLLRTLEALPPRMANVIVLYYLHNASLDEIGRRLEMAPEEIHQLHFEAMDRIRHSLAESG